MKTISKLFLICIVLSGCSILKKDSQKEVHDFVSEFAQSLSMPDTAILAFFSTQQSNESVLKFVRVLQNRDNPGLLCSADFSNAIMSKDNEGILVKILAEFNVDTLDLSRHDTVSFILRLTPEHGTYTITRVDGETFYNTFVSALYDVQGTLNAEEEAEHYRIYFATAKKLREKYDSVIWATKYDGRNYYYVINGVWNAAPNSEINHSMGLVDQEGNIIIPLEYDRIGTIGFELPEVVEVKKNGLYGYFSLEGQLLVAPDNDWIMPYDEGAVFALVSQGGAQGWISKSYVYKEGFPTEKARKYVMNYEFFPEDMTLNSSNYSLCEIPYPDYVQSGIIMPPSYLTTRGVLEEVISDFATPGQPRANIESINASHSWLGSIGDKINAVLTSIKTRYLMGREEFYADNQLIFLDQTGQIVMQQTVGSGNFEFKKIDSTLLEIKIVHVSDAMDYGGDPGDSTEINLPSYVYYRLGENQTMEVLTSNRQFPFTDFVKMDSSYMTGPFNFYSSRGVDSREYLVNETLANIRNEILASYGYIFNDRNTDLHFRAFAWYNPQHGDISEIENLLSDNDRHNLKFLERILGPLQDVSS